MNFDDPDVKRIVRLNRAKELLQPGRAIVASEVRQFAQEGQRLACKPDGLQDALEFRSFGYDLLLRMADQIDAERTVRVALEEQHAASRAGRAASPVRSALES